MGFLALFGGGNGCQMILGGGELRLRESERGHGRLTWCDAWMWNSFSAALDAERRGVRRVRRVRMGRSMDRMIDGLLRSGGRSG